jgi:hypothetical protein
MVSPRSAKVGPASRPVAIPEDFSSRERKPASGRVTLPLHIWWSEPERSFDLSRTEDLRRVYGLVLAEGTEEDVLHFIDPTILIAIWSDLLLPTYVERAWEAWFEENGISV